MNTSLILHTYMYILNLYLCTNYTSRVTKKELLIQSSYVRSKTHHVPTLRQDTERERQKREERERAKKGEIPNHRALPNSISLLPPGWERDYDHFQSTLFEDTIGILHHFPELGKGHHSHSPFSIPVYSHHLLSSILKLTGLCSGFGTTHGTRG